MSSLNEEIHQTVTIDNYRGGVSKADVTLVIIIIMGFIAAGTFQFMIIMNMSFTPKLYVMPIVMAIIFSITLIRLRILRRRFEHEQEQKEYVRSKVHHLNQRLSELLDQRTELLIAAQDQVALAQTRADLGAMAAGVIHDINNALTAIQMGWEGLDSPKVMRLLTVKLRFLRVFIKRLRSVESLRAFYDLLVRNQWK